MTFVTGCFEIVRWFLNQHNSPHTQVIWKISGSMRVSFSQRSYMYPEHRLQECTVLHVVLENNHLSTFHMDAELLRWFT